MTPPRSWKSFTSRNDLPEGRLFERVGGRLRADIESCSPRLKGWMKGSLPRGPERFYVEVHPERIRGFIDIATHPWFLAVCEAVLGKDYRLSNLASIFRSGRSRPAVASTSHPQGDDRRGRLNSLAFKLTTVDHAAGAWSVRNCAWNAMG